MTGVQRDWLATLVTIQQLPAIGLDVDICPLCLLLLNLTYYHHHPHLHPHHHHHLFVVIDVIISILIQYIVTPTSAQLKNIIYHSFMAINIYINLVALERSNIV